MRRFIASAAIAVVVLAGAPALAQTTAADWTAVAGNDYRVTPNITYLTASNWEAKLDVYRPATPGPHPTVLHIHGGGWVGGTREGTALRALPFLEMGYAVVNISYPPAAASRRRRPQLKTACVPCDGSRATPKNTSSISIAS